MLQLENVTKIYKTKAGEVKAVDGISLTFPSSGLVFITGKSGCGKTTLLNLIGGLDGFDEGEIYVQDKKFSEFSPSEYDSYRNTFIGFIFQEYNLLPEFTVEKNIKMAMELQGRKSEDAEFDKLLKDVEIDALKTRNPAELSGGQRQRVAISRALLKQPRIIMADEPTGALDSATGAQVLDALKALSKDKLVIVVSHDKEFAEKYADRVIHLVDGKVAQDITYTDKEITENVSEQENTLIVREGAELTEREKDLLAKGIKERKQISVLENLCFRDKAPTGEVEHDKQSHAVLHKSKMKLKSAVFLGLKSLAVKPIRLIITVLISALAFAVFGLFDTIANFSTERVLGNALSKNASKTVVADARFVLDYQNGDSYPITLSEAAMQALSRETGGTVKGMTESAVVMELRESSVVKGSAYYSRETNGFLEFNAATELDKNGNFIGFNYKLLPGGKYPQSVYKDGQVVEERLYEIAISTYFADSILHYLDGEPLNEKTVTSRDSLLGASITVNGESYVIVGLIDCGDIPEKYAPLKDNNVYNIDMSSLGSDFATYINAGAHKCLFVGEGFMKESQSTAIQYETGNTEWSFTIGESYTSKKMMDYFYNSDAYDGNHILLFSGEYPVNDEIKLADDEVFIHHLNLENLFASEIEELMDREKQKTARDLMVRLQDGTKEQNRTDFAELMTLLGNPVEEGGVTINITQKYLKSGEKITKTLKIVGVYFGIDKNTYTVPSKYKFMINENLMQSFNVYPMQGYYSKLLFSEESVESGMDEILSYLLSKEDLSLSLYKNSALSVIRGNEGMIKQAANLFLYATLVLAVLAVFLLYNYINTSISSKKQSVGVLRGLGAGGKDILLMFLSESLIIALINGLLAVGFALLGCSLVNWYIMDIMNVSMQFALFGCRQVLFIGLISLATALVSSALPIISIAKKKPVELIRRP